MLVRFLSVAMVLTCASAMAAAGEFVEDCGLLAPQDVPSTPVPRKRYEVPLGSGEPGVVRRDAQGSFLSSAPGVPAARRRSGVLSGKTVYLSAGHGFTWTDASDAWRTQRGNTNDIVEDLVSIETVNQLLLPMLLNAGAYVVPVREADLAPRMVVVDNGEAGYAESGSAGTFVDSTVAGWGRPSSPMNGSTLPFGLGNNRLMSTALVADASASWTPNLPADGDYHVYISYTQFTSRVTDAHFVVRHSGGEAHFRVNQRRHGGTWVLLGRFFFRAGQGGSVVALNDSQESGTVSLDAVRFGGGMGDIARGPTPAVSGRPRFEESCRTYAQFAGAPASVFQSNAVDRTADVSCRSRFAAWDHEDGEDAVYVAWHTNAVNGTVRGSEAYVFGTNTDFQLHYSPCQPNTNVCGVASCPYGCGAPGSDLLAQAVHTELLGDIRSGWGEPGWRDGGVRSANFGELNPANNPEMPAVLLEVAYHDNTADAAHLKEPLFRYLAARAITQGIIKYFALKDSTVVSLPPEPPSSVWARNLGAGTVEVGWSEAPTDANDLGGYAATGYRVYQSADGFAWDEGTDVTGRSLGLSVTVGTVRYFRVSATNAGGESFPTPVVGVGAASGASVPVLVVNGYERFEAATAKAENLEAYAIASPLRVFSERMNDGTYVRRHGDAVAYAGVPFDSATAGAVVSGSVPVASYVLIDWFLGRGLAQGAGPGTAEQQLLRAHVEGGRHLLFSGSHAASALARGSAEDQAFLAQVLHAAAGSGTPSLSVEPDSTQFLAGMSGLFLDDGLGGAFDTGTGDVLGPNGGFSLAGYGGSFSTAAVAFDGSGKVVTLGFPFETIISGAHRAEAMGKFLKFFGVITQEPPRPDAGPPIVLSLAPDTFAAPDGCGCTAMAHAPWTLVALVLWARRRVRS
ncbi:MAG: N-acetylmuramoyl-L-alanine amidase [Myxococcota bacterium]